MPSTPLRAGAVLCERLGRRTLGGLILAALALPLCTLGGCGVSAGTAGPSATPTAASTVWGAASPGPGASAGAATAPLPSSSSAPPRAAGRAVDAVGDGSAARLGLSMVPLGAGATPWVTGSLSRGPAWSTIKVPIVMADVRAGRASVSDSIVRAAITESDNAAAETLTRHLGTDRQAAAAVGSELSRYHDRRTRPAATTSRPDFSVLGQTTWALGDQTSFMASLTCDRAQAPLLSLMGQIAQGQRWGLGTLPGARFKGGWGPDAAGDYLVRQTGVITVGSGSYAVSIAAVADDGTFASATKSLDRLAARLPALAAGMPAGSCPGPSS